MSLLVYANMLDKLQKQVYRAVCSTLNVSPKPLGLCGLAVLTVFYRYLEDGHLN